jgi:hypothetical protein
MWNNRKYLKKLCLVCCVLIITSCAFFSKKSGKLENVSTIQTTDNVSAITTDFFSVKDPIAKLNVESKYLSTSLLQESFNGWLGNFKRDFIEVLKSKNIYDDNKNESYIIPEISVQPKVKELQDCDTYIPYLFKKCEKKYFVYIDGELVLNFYKDYVAIKRVVVSFASLGHPNIISTSSLEDVNKKAIFLMDSVYKYLIDYLLKVNNIYIIQMKEAPIK